MPALINHTLFPHPEHTPTRAGIMEDYGSVYGFRSVVFAGDKDDVLQLDPALADHLEIAREHLGAVGLAITENIEWDTAREVALEYPDHYLSPYLFEEGFHQLRPDQRRLDAVENFGDKNKFAQRWGQLMPRTVIVEPGTTPPSGIDDFPMPAFVKAAQSSNGSDIEAVDSVAALNKAMLKVGPRFQVQQKVPDIEASVSKLYFAHEGQATPLAATATIVNGKQAHIGNSYPTVHDPSEATDVIAQDAAEQGLKGFFGLDALISSSGKVNVLECNPRPTWGSYAWVLAARLGLQQSWSGLILPTKLEKPADLNLKDSLSLRYDAASKVGAVVFSTAQMALGNVEVLVSGTAEEQAQIKDDLTKVLNPKRPKLKIAA